jgi:hypothetical protein
MNVNIEAVEAFYNHYHRKVVSYPDLYVSTDTIINVILPNDLLEFANAAAGHSGFGAGARARGIRRVVTNSRVAISEIFETVDSLVEFLLSSECNAEEYVESVRARHLGMKFKAGKKMIIVKTDDRLVHANRSVLTESHGSSILIELADKFSRDTVTNDVKHLNINEFELRYGLQEA